MSLIVLHLAIFVAALLLPGESDAAKLETDLGAHDHTSVRLHIHSHVTNLTGVPTNALSCWSTQEDLSVKTVTCSDFVKKCGVLTFYLTPPSGTPPKSLDSVYLCAPDIVCSDPSIVCDQISKNLPDGWTISSCDINCCSKDNCNDPNGPFAYVASLDIN